MNITINDNSQLEVDLRERMPMKMCNKLGVYFLTSEFVVEVFIKELNYHLVDTVIVDFNENIRITIDEDESSDNRIIVLIGKSDY